MPELPEVETTVRGLARYLEGERIEQVALGRPDMRFPFPANLVQTLTGARVVGLGRRAKYGLVHTDRDDTMVFHLGMSGRWRIDPEAIGKHDHLILATAGHRFALCDPRRFGFVDLVRTAELEAWPPFAAMGPEPLGPELTARYLQTALAGRKQAIKLMLLDQRIVAGLDRFGEHRADRFDVYGREAAACRRGDGGTVRRIVQGGRSTWYCPRCQH